MIYFVTFEIHMNCKVNEMIFHCEANTAKEAKETAKAFWSRLNGFSHLHPFHLYAKKSNIQSIDHLRIRGWEGTEYTGQYVMNHAFCTDTRWREKGLHCRA